LASADLVDPLTVTISVGVGAFAFDEAGGLWVGGQMGTFERLPPAALATGGDVTPDIVITSPELGYVESIALDPAPTWSPIRDF
jgi:hypothetical protein